ncbi:hypothetical protein DFH08DRAFT_404661 [Mycena albidolilacea]|uniref:Zn(2)-C6 fungal-type domain-containing protein n=1 Tax=Mycena albidolilacea TaxID=1033008 RepID=A0AAD7AHK3_9AGAR|nr:hypothetical protein DFH08DRAFT_404661 [Mycena albidolilacea]
MFPNHSRGQKSSPSPFTSPPPGHSRNHIACKNCRKRKLKCITTEKHPRLPCERCVKENVTCEYAAVSNDEESSSRASPAPRWVEPLDPESYARSKGIFPAPPQVPQMHNGYQHNGQTTNPSGSEPPPFPQSGAPQEISPRLPGLLDIFRPVHLIFIMVHFRDLPTQFTPGRNGDLSTALVNTPLPNAYAGAGNVNRSIHRVVWNRNMYVIYIKQSHHFIQALCPSSKEDDLNHGRFI